MPLIIFRVNYDFRPCGLLKIPIFVPMVCKSFHRIFQPFIHFLIHQPGSEALHLSLFATNNWASTLVFYDLQFIVNLVLVVYNYLLFLVLLLKYRN